MAESKFSKIGWIGIGAMISSPITAFFVPLFSRLYEITGDSLASSLAQLYPAITSGFSAIVPYLLGIIGGTLVIADLIHRRRKEDHEPVVIQRRMPDVNLINNLPQTPILQYGKIRMKKSSYNSFGGILESKYYYVEIINTAEVREATNCRGDIKLEGNIYATTWEKNRDYSINIGHKELLFLFEVLDFIKDAKKETRLYLDWGSLSYHTLDDKTMNDYVEKITKEMTVLIHSENAQYPKESESFRRTLQQIISEAVAD